MQLKLFIARFPFCASEHPDGTDWLVSTVIKAKADSRISEVLHQKIDDTPITMSRNRAVKQALANKADVLLMLDSDMSPDLPLAGAKPFWDTSFNYLWQHFGKGPCVIAAPYCGPPPHEVPYIFRWCTFQGDNPNPDVRLEMFSREEAATRIGFETVAALPTGLILIDLRAIERIPRPWFDYEWKDEERSEKASTEDVYFTRNLSLAGVPQVANWDAWAGHVKRKTVSKPQLLTSDAVSEQFRDAIDRRVKSNEKVMVVQGETPAFMTCMHIWNGGKCQLCGLDYGDFCDAEVAARRFANERRAEAAHNRKSYEEAKKIQSGFTDCWDGKTDARFPIDYSKIAGDPNRRVTVHGVPSIQHLATNHTE